MKLHLYKDYYLTSSVGDLCYTLKIIKTITDKKSKRYGEVAETTVNYPDTIQSALNTICEREKLNSRITTWDGYLKEVKILQNMVKELAQEIGADDLVKRMIYQSEEFLSQGDEEEKSKPKKKTLKTMKK